ncbi:helix-turn-helix transcriptional regulator [Phenylobacterium sp. LjRoot219]|uniref:helix-turn-helix domain-containing protein n=1 Tax=Phenylobacterium sp. LjRoot219 TaxID=3342283 RepID=UPI003ED0B031
MDKLADLEAGPNPIDRHVGLRIRLRRKELGISQEKLAESIGLTFQQVQKYERAANRVSASKLWELARALNTSIAYFFEGLGTDGALCVDGGPGLEEFLLTSDGMELARYFPQIQKPRVRRQIIELVRTMAAEPEEG